MFSIPRPVLLFFLTALWRQAAVLTRDSRVRQIAQRVLLFKSLGQTSSLYAATGQCRGSMQDLNVFLKPCFSLLYTHKLYIYIIYIFMFTYTFSSFHVYNQMQHFDEKQFYNLLLTTGFSMAFELGTQKKKLSQVYCHIIQGATYSKIICFISVLISS